MLPIGGGHFVFSKKNTYYNKDIHPEPYLAKNIYKMPSGLLHVAKALEKYEARPSQYILCSERSAAHLAPFSSQFSFVYTRIYQTEAALILAGRRDEIENRRNAVEGLRYGFLDENAAISLLKEVKCYWVVLDSSTSPKIPIVLQKANFECCIKDSGYELWRRRTKHQAN